MEIMPTKDCLDESSIDKLKYLKACIQESYRLMPTAPRLARLVETDVILQDYQIPANVSYARAQQRAKNLLISIQPCKPNPSLIIILFPFGYPETRY